MCSGEALLSRCLRYGANLRVAAFDVLDWKPYAEPRGLPGGHNPLDLGSSAGMAFLCRANWYVTILC